MIKVEDFVVDTFLRLTSKTCPYGFEDNFVNDIMSFIFPDGIQKDKWGNYFLQIGKSRTIFASHLDTVSKDYIPVVHKFDGNFIKTDGGTTLGADDKAGVTVMLWMIENKIPGTYYFFIGEEVGCIGSGNAAMYGEFKGNYDRIISFDRRGTDSVITYQSSSRCCSDDFANELCKQLNKSFMSYKKDTGGVYTDSAEFTHLIPECTNISVGYYKEHTTNEHQDIQHLINLADACLKVDWENLPTKRDASVKEWNDYYYPTSRNWSRKDYGYHDDWDNSDYGQYPKGYGDSMSDLHSNRGKKKRKRNRIKKYYDGGGQLMELTDVNETYDYNEEINSDVLSIQKVVNSDTKYDWIICKFTEQNLEYWELQIIKEQYLDMNSDYDKFFYEYLLDKIYQEKKLEVIDRYQ